MSALHTAGFGIGSIIGPILSAALMNAKSYCYAFTLMGFSVMALSFLQFLSHYVILPAHLKNDEKKGNEFKPLLEEDETVQTKESLLEMTPRTDKENTML